MDTNQYGSNAARSPRVNIEQRQEYPVVRRTRPLTLDYLGPQLLPFARQGCSLIDTGVAELCYGFLLPHQYPFPSSSIKAIVTWHKTSAHPESWLAENGVDTPSR